MTTFRATRSRLPDQKKLKTILLSSLQTQGGMKIREATYQIRESANTLMIKALPESDKEQERQELRQRSTASILGANLPLQGFHEQRRLPAS